MNKKYIFTGIGFLVAALIVWWLIPHGNAPIKNFPSKGTDIVAFGDSLVSGAGADQGQDFVSLLSQRIGKPIINMGVPGDTTANGLARINDLDKYHPKVVLLLLGGNDYLKRVPAEQTFLNLAKIIENIQSRGAIVLLLGIRGGVLQDHFAPQYQKLSERYGTALVSDVLTGLFGQEKYMADEIHPNNAGNAIIADRVYPVLLPLLK